jgi:molecular chaperone DnaJ
MAEDKDLYAILGVSKSATVDELRRAYRKLARKHHPDVNPGDKAAEERFKEISAAYDVLSSPEKRKLYDEFGMAGLREGFDPARAREYQQWARGREATGGSGTGFDFDLGDIFGDIFGGAETATRSARRSRRAPRGGNDVLATVEIDLAQALSGSEIQLEVPTPQTCDRCQGSGEEPGRGATTCRDCGGTGKRQAVRGPMRMTRTCPTCGGSGRIAEPCSKCGGQGVVSRTESVTVRIPPGADTGSRLRVAGRGAASTSGGPRGDLIIETRVRPHPHFRREGLDLHLRLPVTVAEAYEGASVEVPTPTGTVKLRVPPHSQQGSELRLRGKGVRRGGARGDLYVMLDVRLPERDDPKVREAFQVASRAYERPLREGIRL